MLHDLIHRLLARADAPLSPSARIELDEGPEPTIGAYLVATGDEDDDAAVMPLALAWARSGGADERLTARTGGR